MVKYLTTPGYLVRYQTVRPSPLYYIYPCGAVRSGVTVRGEISKSACLSVCSRVLNFPALFDPAGLGPDQLSVQASRPPEKKTWKERLQHC
jgi:hypothetical protein